LYSLHAIEHILPATDLGIPIKLGPLPVTFFMTPILEFSRGTLEGHRGNMQNAAIPSLSNLILGCGII
jgi:hypothetical protein